MTTHSEPFWMVYGWDQSPPRAIHNTFESAKREAERLASCNPGVRFYVMVSCGAAERRDITWRPIDPDAIPF